MEANNIDKVIKDKLDKRTITPSVSAWERLEMQLDKDSKAKKKGWFLYVSIAASVVLLVSIGIQLNTTKNNALTAPKEEFVVTPKEQKQIKENIDKVFLHQTQETEFVSNEKTNTKNTKSTEKSIPVLEPKNSIVMNRKKVSKKQEVVVAEKVNTLKEEVASLEKSVMPTNNADTSINTTLNSNNNSKKNSISINPDDLLYAVTHSPEQVKAYYSKYNVTRDKLLNTIKNELKKSSIKMNPESMLAEVEESIIEDNFQNNFLKVVKERVTLLASTIANRNN